MMKQRRILKLAGAALAATAIAHAGALAAPATMILNEANSVSGGQFIDKGRSDPYLGRKEGHGQNWFEFLVVEGNDLPSEGNSNTLDLRGWSLDWSYKKVDLEPGEGPQFGSGTIRFANDPLWAAVPKGSLLTVSEWQRVWYQTDTSPLFDPWGAGGLERDGGINGLGTVRGNPFNTDPAVHTLLDLSTDATWHPGRQDWHIHVWAGERNLDGSLKYFEFSGAIVDGGNSHAIGTNDAGLFAINNDGWQWTIKNADGVVVQGPFGEAESAAGGGNWGVNPTEIIKLEAFDAAISPTAANYLSTNVSHYRDGSTGSFGAANSWSSGGGFQDLSSLRAWLVEGDADLDGLATGNDFLAWQRGMGLSAGADLRDGDLTADAAVDGNDLGYWAGRFGNSSGGGAVPTPEPAAWALGALAFAGAANMRHRCRTSGSSTTRRTTW